MGHATAESIIRSGRLFLSYQVTGGLSKPIELTESVADAANLTPPFAITEQHGGGARRVRTPGDMEAPGINAIATFRDTSIAWRLEIRLRTPVIPASFSPAR